MSGNEDLHGNAAYSDYGYGFMLSDDIEDWYVLEITQPSTVTISLEVNQADLDLLLTGVDGPYNFEDGIAHSGNSGSVDESLTHTLLPGRYLIAITAYDPEGPYPTTAYTLSIRGGIGQPSGETDFGVSFVDAPALAVHASQVTYRAHVTNAGPDDGTASIIGPTPENTTLSNVVLPAGAELENIHLGESGFFYISYVRVPAGGSADIDITLDVRVPEGQSFNFHVIASVEGDDENDTNNRADATTTVTDGAAADLSWTPPAGGPLDPPTNLTASVATKGSEELILPQGAPATVTGYKIYRTRGGGSGSTQPTAGNLFGAFPPNQTTARVPVSSGTTRFVVTACYGMTESAPSNEASVTVQGPTISSLKVKAKALSAVGTFNSTVQVYIDGVPFATPAKVKKNNTKVQQKGALADGRTLQQLLSAGAPFKISFKNENGGITELSFTP